MNPSILIVDDEATARRRLRRLLAGQEVEIVGESRDGLEALTAIRDLRPEIVLLDIQMPGWTVSRSCVRCHSTSVRPSSSS